MTDLATIGSKIKAKVKDWLGLVKEHETLIFILVAGTLIWHFYGSTLTAWEKYQQAQASVAAQQVQVDAAKDKLLQTELATITKQLAEANKQAEDAILSRDRLLLAQQKADENQTPTERLQRLQQLLAVAPQDLQSSPIVGSVTFDEAAAIKVEQQLEEIPVLQADNANLKDELSNDEQLIQKQTDVIAGTQKELADEKVSHQDDVKALKTENKRQFNRGLKWGLILGAVGGEVIRVVITHGL